MNKTLQSHLPVDLELLGITSLEAANHYLPTWIKKFNQRFAQPVKESVFEKSSRSAEINLLLARITKRVINNGHHVRYQNHYYLPTSGDQSLYFIKKSKVLVIEAFDGEIYLNIADKIYIARKLLSHELVSSEFDEVVEKKKERRKYIPPQSHPWKLASFKKYLHKLNKKMEDYKAENTA